VNSDQPCESNRNVVRVNFVLFPGQEYWIHLTIDPNDAPANAAFGLSVTERKPSLPPMSPVSASNEPPSLFLIPSFRQSPSSTPRANALTNEYTVCSTDSLAYLTSLPLYQPLSLGIIDFRHLDVISRFADDSVPIIS
jgi:hypothetical protein